MESTKFLTASLLAAGLMAVGTSANAALTDDLVGYYQGESNANSGLASDADALVNVGVGVNAAGGLIGGAFEFDNTQGDTLTALTPYGTAGGEDLSNQTFTVQAWFNANSNAATANRHFIWENASDYDFAAWVTGADDSTIQMFTSGSSTQTLTATHTAGTWQHIAQVITTVGGNVTVDTYINGQLDTSDTVAAASAGALVAGFEETVGINFGRARTPASDRPFDGLLDEIAIWDRALTAGEVNTAYLTGAAGQTLDNEVPEPGSLALLGLGGLALLRRRRG